MSGETNLSHLIASMQPVLDRDDYVFVTVDHTFPYDRNTVKGIFKENEGTTLILPKKEADKLNFGYDYVSACITLSVHSSLHAVGLTAAFSKALAENQISCNVVAAYYHDHIFVDKMNANKAMDVLLKMTNANKSKK